MKNKLYNEKENYKIKKKLNNKKEII